LWKVQYSNKVHNQVNIAFFHLFFLLHLSSYQMS
jgi:hypothetical protein